MVDKIVCTGLDELFVSQWTCINGNGEASCCDTCPNAEGSVFDNNGLLWVFYVATPEAFLIGIGIRFATIHVISGNNMLLVEVLPEVIEQSLEERTLSAASDNRHLSPMLPNGMHQVVYSIEDCRCRHIVKQARLYVVHLLCLFEANVTLLLFVNHLPDGVNASCSFRSVCIGSRHANAELCHSLLPGYGMIGHGIIEYAVHIEEHGFYSFQ